MAILNKNKLVECICLEHQNLYGFNITPIKLQKALYFLYAFWGGIVMEAKLMASHEGCFQVEDETIKDLDPHLFDANFEAWSFGPVDREIYLAYKNDKLHVTKSNDLLVNADLLVSGFVKSTLVRIFNTNDFALVDLACEDDSWKMAYANENKKMDSNLIIQEYGENRLKKHYQ